MGSYGCCCRKFYKYVLCQLVSQRKQVGIFTARAYARAVLGVVILSVRPSVCLSVTRVDCDKTKWRTADILHHTKGQSLCYSDTNSGWWATPPSFWNLRSKWPTRFEQRQLRPISAHNVSTVGDSRVEEIIWLPCDAGLSVAAETLVGILNRVFVSPAVYPRFLEIAELARSLCHSWATCSCLSSASISLKDINSTLQIVSIISC